MDSLTQALLGGAVGVAVAGRHGPRRAWLYGAIAGTAPDLDVLIDYASAVDDFTRHRGFSHSWLVHTVVAPLLAPVLARLDRGLSAARWTVLLWLAFVTHSGLDALTVYGTQLFWPLPLAPVMGGSVFIIDPLYSLPLAILALMVLIRPPAQPLRASGMALAVSTAYLGWGLIAQHAVGQRVAAELDRQGVEAQAVAVAAAPFTTLLWRVLVMTPSGYLEGFASVLDPSPSIRFAAFERGSEYRALLEGNADYERLAWFSHGFGALRRVGDKVIFEDLRMGLEPSYVFRFVLMRHHHGTWRHADATRLPRSGIPRGLFASLWSRTFDPAADAHMIALAAASEQDHRPDECGKTEADQNRC